MDSNNNGLSLTLVAIPFSHYNERARWGLDLAGLNYKLVRTLPLIHFAMVWVYQLFYERTQPNASVARVGSNLATPMLCVAEGGGGRRKYVIHDSGDILQFCDTIRPAVGLFPVALWSAADADLMRKLHDELGPAVRMWVYTSVVLRDTRIYCDVGRFNGPFWQFAIWWIFGPIIRWMLRRAYKMSDERTERALGRIVALFEQVSSVLSAAAAARGGGPDALGSVYLGGDNTRFTAVDLTFASLGGIVCGVTHEHGYGGWLPSLNGTSTAVRAAVARLAATPAGKHALRMYAMHRK